LYSLYPAKAAGENGFEVALLERKEKQRKNGDYRKVTAVPDKEILL